MDRQRRGGRIYHGNKRPVRKGSFRGCPFRGQYKWYSQRGFTLQRDFRDEDYRTHFKRPLRPPSPVEGSEEYMTRKIQETSAKIMRQLLSPQESETPEAKINDNDKQSHINNILAKAKDDKINNKSPGKTKKANHINLNAKEIHEKIMNHITSLNKGRKHNFVNANSSTGLDRAIEDMQKQQRLEISRILRDMNSSSTNEENGIYTNSIVPDIGIKIEELPFDIIEELKQTLNLDLEYLNEVIANSSDFQPANVEQLEINNLDFFHEEAAPAGPVEIKEEAVDSDFVCVENNGQDGDSIDMNLGSDSDRCVEEETQTIDNDKESKEEVLLHHSISIKEEDERSTSHASSDSLANCSASTVVFPYRRKDVQSQTVESSTSSLSNHTLNSLENTIRQFIESDKDPECTQDNALEKIDLVDLCVKHLTNYRRCLTKSFVTYCKRDRSNRNSEQSTYESIVPQNKIASSSHAISEAKHADKRKKISNDDTPQDTEVKSESSSDFLEINHILKFPKLNERIIATERVENELLLATESGNIIFARLEDGSFFYRLDVSQCTITSLTIVRGINDFIYLYVGCREEVLRVYDFRKRQLLKASRIDDQITCMDSMWDYVFMGCKRGTLIRYSCKKAKVEYEDKNIDNEILVLKASQEGPRRVLLVGHRQAPIYVRDALSGLHLRSFSNIAITPTVYSLVLNGGYLYCGTAKNDILVFSFHEGHLLERIVTDNSKGISCMKIYKNKFLFAGCYNGSIYVYNLKGSGLVTVLKGPGGGVLCMEVFHNQVIVGTLTGQFDSVSFPSDIVL